MSIVYAIVGAFLAILGLVIWKKQMVGIIAGYDKKKTRDNAGLAKWVGRNMVVAGVLWVVFAIILMVAQNVSTTVKVLVPIAVLAVVCVMTAVGCKKYEN